MPKVIELAGPPSSYNKTIKKSKQDVDPLDYMEDIINASMTGMQHEKVTQVKRKREFRSSGLPFCPILQFLREPQEENYAKSHYTSTGTAIHESIQGWLSVTKTSQNIMWGSWKCTGCQQIKFNQYKPKKLCDCKFVVSTTEQHRGWPKHWTYHEVEFEYRGLTGHIDLILWPKPDFAFVPDFKTSEQEKKRLRWNWKADKVSSPNYVAQIRTYASILTLEHGLPIKGWALINVERGRPITKATDYHTQLGVWNKKKAVKWMENIDRAADNNKILTKLEDAVEKGDRDGAEKQIDRMIKNRPCVDQDSYDRFMQYGFYQGSCEHCSTCFSGSHKAIKRMILTELSKKT